MEVLKNAPITESMLPKIPCLGMVDMLKLSAFPTQWLLAKKLPFISKMIVTPTGKAKEHNQALQLSDWLINIVVKTPLLKNPDNFINLGRFGAPHGVHGLINVDIFSRTPEFIASQRLWWVLPANATDWITVDVLSCLPHGKRWLVKIKDVNDRNDADKWCHSQLGIRRDDLPPIEDSTEFYWHDLIGLNVRNKNKQDLGEVVGLIESVNHDILEVKEPTTKDILLIPYHRLYVLDVNLTNGCIDVDWQIDW